MTEVVVDSTDQQTSSNTVPQPTSSGAGQLLRQARERQHLSVQAIASTLKVPVYKVQALEEDRWDVLTDSVFTRSLALSVCRLLNIPAEDVLAGLPKHEAAKLASNPEGINAPFKEKTLRSLMSHSQDTGSGNAVKVIAALLIAVAGGAGLYFVPQWQSGEASDVGANAEDVAVVESLFMPPLQTAPEAPAEEVAAPVVIEAVAVETVAEKPAQAVVVPDVAASKPGVLKDAPVLRFAVTGESWVQVRDAKDQIVLDKILKAGDVYEETRAGRPLQVVVGNASATKLEIDGAVFDLAASAKNNVARFEVK